MRLRGHAIGMLLFACLVASSTAAAAKASLREVAGPSAGSLLLTPDVITDEEGRTIEVERGLLFVPENRARPDSRLIAVHFIRFPPTQAQASGREPVFLLPGGPGWDFDFSDSLVFDEVERLRRTRSVISVSQRGYSGSPGLVPELRVTYEGGVPTQAVSASERAMKDRGSLAAAIEVWQGRGVDLTGYDILNITDDVNDLRQALGYGKIVLRGCSFGSQWSLAYMQRWPETVDRALLSGVEPLGLGYDSPDWLWASMSRVAQAAANDPALARSLPPGGLMQALTTVIARLEAHPAQVTIRSPTGDEAIVVPVTADDLRASLSSLSLNRRRPLENLGQWPRFILEMYNGDYRFLAVRAAQERGRTRSESLVLPLINHSVGVSSAYADHLRREDAGRWLGDINLKEHVTRAAATTPQVTDAFRADIPLSIPTVMIAGDYDWSTPIENAEHLSHVLPFSRVVQIEGGRHCTETNYGELSAQRPEDLARIYRFLDGDIDPSNIEAAFDGVPEHVKLDDLNFQPTLSGSLYDEWLASRD